MKVGFSLGALSKSLEEQANEQGCTFGNNAEKWEKASDALIRLRFNLELPDGMYRKLQDRLFDKMIKDVTRASIQELDR